ncbi:MAG: hypothetical protein S4CHLAM37_12820 [Chlamydiia bacterium]|nr:hypothetical protein [Chlamydiia bacterium]
MASGVDDCLKIEGYAGAADLEEVGKSSSTDLMERVAAANKRTFELLAKIKGTSAANIEAEIRGKKVVTKKSSKLPAAKKHVINTFLESKSYDEIEEIIVGLNTLTKLFSKSQVAIVYDDVLNHRISEKDLRAKVKRRLVVLAKKIDQKSESQRTPVEHAIRLRMHELTTLFLDLEAATDETSASSDTSSTSSEECSSAYLKLAITSHFDHPTDETFKTVEELLKRGGNPNERMYGMSLLETAINHEDIKIVSLLIKHSADVDTLCMDPTKTLLEVAFQTCERDSDIFLLLANHTNFPSAIASYGDPLLFTAAKGGMVEVVFALIGRGADPNMVSSGSETLAYIANTLGAYSILDELVKIDDFTFDTTLHLICANQEDLGLIEFLEEYGDHCDLSYRTDDHLTPMERLSHTVSTAPILFKEMKESPKATMILSQAIRESSEIDRRQNFYGNILPLQLIAALADEKSASIVLKDIDLLNEEQLKILGNVISANPGELREAVLTQLLTAKAETIIHILPHIAEELRGPFLAKARERIEELTNPRALSAIASEIRSLEGEISSGVKTPEVLRKKASELKSSLFAIRGAVAPFKLSSMEIGVNTEDAAHFVVTQMQRLAKTEQMIPKEAIEDEDIDAFSYLARFLGGQYDPARYVEVFGLESISDISKQGLASLKDIFFITEGLIDDADKLAAIKKYLRNSKATWDANADMSKDLSELVAFIQLKLGHKITKDELKNLDGFISEHSLDLR